MKKAFYFENTENGSSKFWAIEIIKEKNYHFLLIRRWGKIGDSGRTMSERFYNLYDAQEKREHLIREKKLKGYEPIL